MIHEPEYYRCEPERHEFSHAGDLGDIIWGTAAIRLWLETRQLESATLYLYDEPGKTTHSMTKERFALIAPLLDSQPWLKAAFSAVRVISNFNGFRDHMRSWKTIAGAHLGALGFGNEAHTAAVERIWLEVPASEALAKYENAVIFVRTVRYKSHDFPWAEMIEWFGEEAIFLGLEGEYQSFVNEHPQARHIPYVQTKNHLEAAQIIDRSKLFVGNQTSLFAIAEALKRPRVLEPFVCLANCDYGSRNCLPVWPGTKISKARVLELGHMPFTV